MLIDEERAIKSLPKLIKGQEKEAAAMLENIRKVVTVSGTMTEESTARLETVAAIFSPTALIPAEPCARRVAAAKEGQPRGRRKTATT